MKLKNVGAALALLACFLAAQPSQAALDATVTKVTNLRIEGPWGFIG